MRVWISDNDLLKLAESTDEERIRVSAKRTHLRIHAVEIPALARPALAEKCECGRNPATRYDSDAVALCDECYDALPMRPNP